MENEAKNNIVEPEEKSYKTISTMIDKWLKLHQDETFSLDDICRHLVLNERENRDFAAQKLAYLVRQGKLEKDNRIYRYINNNITNINWWENNGDQTYFELNFPSNHQDTDLSYFSFQDSVRMSPGSVIVVAGQTNAGKSTFARNLLWDNMDKYKIRFQVSQTSGPAFARYALNMKWANPMKTTNTPKFELIERFEDFQDLIVPNTLNIVDWLDADKIEYFKVGMLIKAMQTKLQNGVLAVMMQKNSNSEYGDGGEKSAKWADLYLTLSHNKEKNFTRLNVVKAKEWVGNKDPNGKIYGFEIIDYGAQFANIREVRRCPRCYGSGRDKQNNECTFCAGVGYEEVSKVTHQPKKVKMPVEENIPF